MIIQSPLRTKNSFLNSLSAEDLLRIDPYLEKIEMPLGMPIFHFQEPIKKVYFPETAVISVVTLLEDGSGVESGIIGRDSIAGAEVILSKKGLTRESMVQLSGFGWQLDAEIFEDVFEQSRSFSRNVLHAVHSFIGQISQNAACLCFHPVEARLARWLLMFDDRTDKPILHMTQEFISMMLGVHRPTLSRAASKLQELGFIQYNRGRIKIINRPQMKKFACECYDAIKEISAV